MSAQSPEMYDAIESAFENNIGFSMKGLYCQVTGKRIGTIDSGELLDLIDSLCGEGEADAEAIADDISIRLLASMRPSMRWNKMRSETLQQMRVEKPIELTAYLVNRLFAPLNWRKLGIDVMLGFYADRIKAYQLIESWGQTDAANTILYMLLELDAKWNLDTESPPFSAYDFFFDAPTMEHRVEMLQAWHERRMAAYDKRVKAEEQMMKWHRSGAALAKPAFLDAWTESKPLTKTAVVKAEKKAEKDFFSGLLSEIMMGRVETPDEAEAIKPKVTFIPNRKTPMRFGVK